MQDLTEGSISRHIVKLAVPIAIGMVFQTMYYLVDLFFVGQLGDAAVAGLTSAGNVQFLVMAVTQILGVGTMALIAQASGRKDREDANLSFNQSLGQAAVCAVGTVVFGLLVGRALHEYPRRERRDHRRGYDVSILRSSRAGASVRVDLHGVRVEGYRDRHPDGS